MASMRQLLVITILLAHCVGAAIWPADARSDSGCSSHSCSNDASSSDAIYGDELLEWQPIDTWATKPCPGDESEPCTTAADERCYEVATYPELRVLFRLCERSVFERSEAWRYEPPQSSVSPYRVGPEDFPRYGESKAYVVRGCAGADCGAWAPRDPGGSQSSVDFVGGAYACFGQEQGRRCEKRCYSGAAKAFAEIADCDDPN